MEHTLLQVEVQVTQKRSNRFFPNQATLVEPALSQTFTQDVQDLFTRQTNLTLTILMEIYILVEK